MGFINAILDTNHFRGWGEMDDLEWVNPKYLIEFAKEHPDLGKKVPKKWLEPGRKQKLGFEERRKKAAAAAFAKRKSKKSKAKSGKGKRSMWL